MITAFGFGIAVAVITYLALQFLLHATQNEREPRLTESRFPFLDSAIGIVRQRSNYLVGIGYANTGAYTLKRLT